MDRGFAIVNVWIYRDLLYAKSYILKKDFANEISPKGLKVDLLGLWVLICVLAK